MDGCVGTGFCCCTFRTFLFLRTQWSFSKEAACAFLTFLQMCLLVPKQRRHQVTAQMLNQLRSAFYSNLSIKENKVCFLLYVSRATSAVSDTQEKCVHYFVTCPILTNSACRASSFLRADFGDSGSTSLKDRRLSMFWGEKGT